MNKLALLLMVLANLPLLASGQTVTNSLMKGPACPILTWEPSLDSAVTGYYVKYGEVAQATTRVLDVGNRHSLILSNLAANSTNFIYVTAHDATGAESDPSEVMLYCPIPEAAAAAAPTTSPNGGETPDAPAITPASATPGSVIRSTALTLSVRQAAVAVRFPVAAGIRYDVQASTDLETWTTVGVAEPEVAGISEYVDANAVQAGQRFYRVVTEEPQALVLR